jgi:hypothetical protein
LAVGQESVTSAFTSWAALLASCSSLPAVVWDVTCAGVARIATDANANALKNLKWCMFFALSCGTLAKTDIAEDREHDDDDTDDVEDVVHGCPPFRLPTVVGGTAPAYWT